MTKERELYMQGKVENLFEECFDRFVQHVEIPIPIVLSGLLAVAARMLAKHLSVAHTTRWLRDAADAIDADTPKLTVH